MRHSGFYKIAMASALAYCSSCATDLDFKRREMCFLRVDKARICVFKNRVLGRVVIGYIVEFE